MTPKPRSHKPRLTAAHRQLKADEHVDVSPAIAACIAAHFRNGGGLTTRLNNSNGTTRIWIIKEKTK